MNSAEGLEAPEGQTGGLHTEGYPSLPWVPWASRMWHQNPEASSPPQDTRRGIVTGGNPVLWRVCRVDSMRMLWFLPCADHGNTAIPLCPRGFICIHHVPLLVFPGIWVLCKDILDSKGERSKFEWRKLKECVGMCPHPRGMEGKG